MVIYKNVSFKDFALPWKTAAFAAGAPAPALAPLPIYGRLASIELAKKMYLIIIS